MKRSNRRGERAEPCTVPAAVVLAKKNHPSLQQFFATYIVPCEDNINQNPSPLTKCFWGLFEKVIGHFVITTGFPTKCPLTFAILPT